MPPKQAAPLFHNPTTAGKHPKKTRQLLKLYTPRNRARPADLRKQPVYESARQKQLKQWRDQVRQAAANGTAPPPKPVAKRKTVPGASKYAA